MSPEKSEIHLFPVADCKACKTNDVPFNEMRISKEPYTKIIYCLKCKVPVDEITPKGYLSIVDLEELDWAIEL